MWDASSFDQSAGGFQVDGMNQIQSPKRDQNRTLSTVVPLLIKQITECTDEVFKLWGLPVQMAQVVGVLKKFDVQSTKANCLIQDHSGEIDAFLWLTEKDNSDSSSNIPPVREGIYVQVFGSIRQQEGKKILMILKMFPVEDCNVITTHLLSVIHARVGAESMSKNGGNAFLRTPSTALATSMSGMDVSSSTNGNGPAAPSSTTNHLGLSKIQDQVYKILQPCQSASGMHRKQILEQFKPNQALEVNTALEFLINEGHAYSTIDNDHFKATDSM